MNTASLDTSIILRLLLRDVPEQRQLAVDLIAQFDRLNISDIAISEAVFVMGRNYQLPRNKIADALLDFLKDPKYNCNRPLFTRAFPYFVAHPALSFEDCCLAAYAELNNATPLYTFDQKLARQIDDAQLVC